MSHRDQEELLVRYPQLAGNIDYAAFRAALDALNAAQEHLDEYTTPHHPDPDVLVWQVAILDRLSDVPEPARTWMRHWAGIEEKE